MSLNSKRCIAELPLRAGLIRAVYTCQYVRLLYSVYCHRNSEIQHFECSDTIEIRNRIIFIFYPGLRLYIHTLYIDPYCLRVCVPLTEPDAQGAEVHECRSERQAV